MLTLIPEKKLKSYIDLNLKASTFCEGCNKLIENAPIYPYGYDEEENDVYFVGKCPNCGELFFIKE